MTDERPPHDDALLSRILFESRERVSMAGYTAESRTGRRDEWARRLVAQIDDYRASRGWPPDGYGGEDAG